MWVYCLDMFCKTLFTQTKTHKNMTQTHSQMKSHFLFSTKRILLFCKPNADSTVGDNKKYIVFRTVFIVSKTAFKRIIIITMLAFIWFVVCGCVWESIWWFLYYPWLLDWRKAIKFMFFSTFFPKTLYSFGKVRIIK